MASDISKDLGVPLPPSICEKVKKFTYDMKNSKLESSYLVAQATLDVLQLVVSDTVWSNAKELLDILKQVGHHLINIEPTEASAGNIVRRVLKTVRDEYYTCAKGMQVDADTQESLQKMLLAEESTSVEKYDKILPGLKDAIRDSIEELRLELETSADNIANQALEHIHADEIIMTAGKSRTVEAFLKSAASKRRFQVVIAECAPFYHGQVLAKSLAKAGIESTLIPDSAIFAIMARVNKVIIGTHSVLADGGLRAVSGAHALALAAKHYSVPLLVCTAMFKFTPQFLCSHDQEAFNRFSSPQEVMEFSAGRIISGVQVINPVFDYVPPQLVTIFISNIGGNSPSYVYRLISELYHPDDYTLELPA